MQAVKLETVAWGFQQRFPGNQQGLLAGYQRLQCVTQETTTSGTVGFTDSFINNFKIIGPGPGNNILIHENLQITVNANGTLTVALDHLTAECK